MIDLIETFLAFAETGSMQKAALKLRVTQPTVSKRIAQLQQCLGKSLIEPEGRGVSLTRYGQRFAKEAHQRLLAIKELLELEEPDLRGTCVLGIAESVMLGWHQKLFGSRPWGNHSSPHVEIHSHRTPVVLHHVTSGDYHLGIVAGDAGNAPSHLESLCLMTERFCLVSHQPELPSEWFRHIITIEPTSSTWQEVGPQWARRSRAWKLNPRMISYGESFTSATLLAAHGFGIGLVPTSIAESLKVPGTFLHPLPQPGLTRRISLIARKSSLKRKVVKQVWEEVYGRFEAEC